MTRFILKINLGNATMRTGYNISMALREIADKINDNGDMRDFSGLKNIRDINGNIVGSWQVK